ncbi:hypothetical protein V5799_030276 [Amblyomma americanum]|uniref:ATP synthase mitochondrial F1 complex assembly factor 1 n=1 Tax=Amblyomma americanum TaxID=6943 RepID=A0AAQ4ENN9_AMBAM
MALFRSAWCWRTVFQRLTGAPSSRELAASFTISARTQSSEADRPAYSNNPFYKKYADKIKELERRDPEALKRRQEEISRTIKTKAAGSTSGDATPSPSSDNHSSEVQEPKDRRCDKLQQEPTYVRPSKFDADAIRELRSRCKSTAELTDAWKALHSARDAVCAVIPSSIYETIRERARDYPVFLYPLPRDGSGYEFVLSQFVGDQCHMTPLASYQLHGSEAPACLALTYWTQLASREDGGVVLMNGEYDSKVVGPTEAQCLVNQLQLYYGGNELKKKLLLWNFNREPRSFKHEMLIREFEASATREQDEGSSVRQG